MVSRSGQKARAISLFSLCDVSHSEALHSHVLGVTKHVHAFVVSLPQNSYLSQSSKITARQPGLLHPQDYPVTTCWEVIPGQIPNQLLLSSAAAGQHESKDTIRDHPGRHLLFNGPDAQERKAHINQATRALFIRRFKLDTALLWTARSPCH